MTDQELEDDFDVEQAESGLYREYKHDKTMENWQRKFTSSQENKRPEFRENVGKKILDWLR